MGSLPIEEDTLVAIAEAMGGTAILCNNEGAVLYSSSQDTQGGELLSPEMRSWMADAAADIVRVRNDGITTLGIRFQAGFLLVNNRDAVRQKAKYRQVIEASLPYIAQVAGGDAVLFNQDGLRVNAVHPDGSPNPGAQGVLNYLCKQVMTEIRPSIGPSVMAPGSTAVRIPLSNGYGLAFNNRLAAKQRQRLMDTARQYHYARYHIEDIIGESSAIARAKQLTRDAAKSSTTVLITGETGTGKELFAQALHNLSDRAAQPFVAINCGALPAELVESTMFGYVEGAFTGAKKVGRPGAFEQANGGTLFLDEISEMPFPLQVKLLRVLQEREVTRVGDTKAAPVDVRIIASTNKSLVDLIKSGQFRSDLYFRINVFGITIPSLRERGEDILAITDFFMKKYSTMLGKPVQDITPGAMQALMRYRWPGNVRELQNCLEYAFNIISPASKSILPEHLPPNIMAENPAEEPDLSLYEECMRKTERELVVKALKVCGNNKAEAARRLGINRTTLWRIINRHHLLAPNELQN